MRQVIEPARTGGMWLGPGLKPPDAVFFYTTGFPKALLGFLGP